MNEPIQTLELVLNETNSLSVREAERAELIATLKPIAAEIQRYLDYASALTVNTQGEAEVAALTREAILNNAEKAEKALREFDNKLIERLFRTHRAWTGLLNAFKEPFGDAAQKIKRKIIDFQEAEQEKARKEQERLQAEADEKARRERERLEKEAARQKTPEKKQERLEAAAQIVAPIVRVAAPEKAVATRKVWRVVKFDLATFIKAAAVNPSLLIFFAIEKNDFGFAKASLSAQTLCAAKARNSMLEIPGVEFRQFNV